VVTATIYKAGATFEAIFSWTTRFLKTVFILLVNVRLNINVECRDSKNPWNALDTVQVM
jgi:hypothetical protein